MWPEILVPLLIVHDLEQVPSLFSQKLSEAHFSPAVKWEQPHTQSTAGI